LTLTDYIIFTIYKLDYILTISVEGYLFTKSLINHNRCI